MDQTYSENVNLIQYVSTHISNSDDLFQYCISICQFNMKTYSACTVELTLAALKRTKIHPDLSSQTNLWYWYIKNHAGLEAESNF